MNRGAHGQEQGFSLIEAMVALSILAIAAVGLVRTVESHIDSTRALERRAAAMIVAENRLAELRLGSGAAGPETVSLLGGEWRVAQTLTGTDDPSLSRVRVEVFAAGETAPMASLDGFVQRAGS